MASDVQPKHDGPLPKPRKNRRGKGAIARQRKRQNLLGALNRDKQWDATRADWFDLHPPDIGEEWYQCALCPYPVHMTEVTLDHVQTRSRRPDLKYDLDNLQPSHPICNGLRGSMTMEAWNRQRAIKIDPSPA